MDDPWVLIGLGWESRRLSPIIEDMDDAPQLTPQQRMARIVASRDSITEAMRECKLAAPRVRQGIEADAVLREEFAACGITTVVLDMAIVDPQWEPGFTSPRYTLKAAKQLLDVDAWAFYDGPVEAGPFAEWLDRQLRDYLRAWLDR